MQADFLQDDAWLSELTQDTRGFLNLRHDIMERTCRYLSQQDLMQLCQVSPTWSPAAKAILWEAPVFKNPKSLRQFVASAFQRKNLALQVKHLSLCLRDEEYPTVFRPVLDSTLFRHTKENTLWLANLIIQLVRQCENIQTLKVYGWKLNPMHVEQIGATLTHLHSLTIIGTSDSFQQTFVLRNTLSKLRELRLDGHFVLSLPFASNLATRASSLRSLYAPIMGMEREALTALCSGTLNLTSLTLTYASPMTDSDVQEVLSRFVNLKTFTLHGTEKVTANIIATAISKCRHLESLELRADPRSFKKHTGTDWSTTTASTSTALKRLVIENMIVPDSVLYDLSQSCHSLTVLGINNCRDISDSAMQSLLYASNHLRLFHVIKCPAISDQTLDALGKSNARQTIQNIHIESSGSISSQAIHQLCCAATEYTLQHLRLVDYTDIAQSDIGTYSIERNVSADDSKPVVTLDERAIDAIATASRYDFAPMPKNRYLTGEQLLKLAKDLNIDPDEFEDAIERVQGDSELDEQEDEVKDQSEPEQASASPEYEDSEAEQYRKPLSRVSSLKHPLRPTTPAIWAAHGNDSEIQKYLPQSSSASISESPTRYSRLSRRVSATLIPEPEEPEPESIPEPVDDFEDSLRESQSQSSTSAEETPQAAQFMEEEPIATPQEEWPSLRGSSTASKKRGSEVELGGWGVQSTSLWSKKITVPTKQPDAPPRAQTDQPWKPYTVERHGRQWQQTALEPQAPRAGRSTQRRSFVMQADGWGQPKTHIPWDDLRHQGFAHDVLEQQKQTAFWDNTTQQWNVPNKETPPAPVASQSQSKLATVAWPSINEAKPPVKKSQPSKKQANKRHSEPLSDDEDKINWDLDDGITIKTSPTLGPQYRQGGPSKGPSKTSSESTRRAKAASDKQRNDEGGIAQWRDFAALTVQEQVQRSLNPRPDTQVDLLVDTSDVVNGKNESSELRPATRSSSYDPSLWKDVESLTLDSSPPEPSKVKNDLDDLVDMSDVIMSPTAEPPSSKMQQPLIPQINNISPQVLQPSNSIESSATETLEPHYDIQSVAAAEANSDSHTLVAGESTLEMDLLGPSISTPQSVATPPSSSEDPSSPPGQSGPGKRVGQFDFELPDRVLPPLNCYENVELEESVRQYCEENGIPDLYSNIMKSIRPAYNARRTKMILNKRKKKPSKRSNNNQLQTPPT